MSLMGAIDSGLGVLEPALRKPQKIEVACDCGKRYRVGRRQAGKKIRCKGCGERVAVPAESLTSHDAQAILSELGIDPALREHREAAGSGVACFFCNARLSDEELAEAADPEQAVCFHCRSSASAAPVPGPAVAEPAKKQPLTSWVAGPSDAFARRRAWQYAGLFLAGFTGLLHSVFGVGWILSLLCAGLTAAGGWQLIYRASQYEPERGRRREPGANRQAL